MNSTSVDAWRQMSALLEERGFQPYPIGDNLAPNDEVLDADAVAESGLPLTMIQLVRLTMGLPMAMVDFPTFAFWNSDELQKKLDKIWSGLDSAVTDLHPGNYSIVAWCFRVPSPSVSEILRVIEVAKSKSGEVHIVDPTPRPMSSGLVQPKSLQTTVFNMIGVVRTTCDLGYGDLLTQLANRDQNDVELLQFLDSRIADRERKMAQADRDTPIPALITRAFFIGNDPTRTGTKLDTITQFLRRLDESNNLAGLSDQALTRRLVPAASDVASGANGRFPAQLKKLIENHLSTSD